MATASTTKSQKYEVPTVVIIEERETKGRDGILRKYIRGKFLGKGAYSTCYELINMDTRLVAAAKIMAKINLIKSRAKAKLWGEIKIHRALHHKNIIQFLHVFEDQDNVYLLLELCSNQVLP